MVISIIRKPSEKGCTLSTWYVDGQYQCVGIEDVVRGQGQPKVHGQTAIPAGTYRVRNTMSTRFKRILPQLFDQPGKTTLFGSRPIDNCGVRIHSGNYATDTEGCLLPGTTVAAGGTMVTNSRVAFDSLFAKINEALARKETITLTIR
jgi:hypothetical protein